MEYISSFTKTLTCVIIISFVLRALLPRSSLEKYINFVIGLIISVTLVGAFSTVGIPILDDVLPQETAEGMTESEARAIYNAGLRTEFEKSLKRRVADIVQAKFAREIECDIMLSEDTDGTICGIDGIYIRIYGVHNATDVRKTVAEALELDEKIIHVGGYENEF